MDEQKEIELLQSTGFNPVYVWQAEPDEDDSDHAHDFDTKLIVLEGNISIGINDKIIILKPGDSVEIPRNKTHSGKAGSAGCKYIVAERH